MSGPPKSSSFAASVTRSQASQLSSLADEMLRAPIQPHSTVRKVPNPSSSASVSRASTSSKIINELADQLLSSSISKPGNTALPSSTLTAPPSYRTDGVSQPKSSNDTEYEDTSDKAKKQKLQEEVESANAKAPRTDAAGIMRAACSTDILFLMDTTNSMAPYIESAKQQVRSILSDIQETFFNESSIRFAVVAYKDHHQSYHTNIQFLEFTESASEVHAFLSQLKAYIPWPGLDEPEDVLGRLHKAIYANWQ